MQHSMPTTTTTTMLTGPPAKSWSLTFDLAIAIVSDLLRRSSSKTVEDLQRLSTTKGAPVPSDMKRHKVLLPQDYRVRAGNHLGCLFTAQDEQAIGWDWKSDKKRVKELKGEWMQPKKVSSPLKRTILYLHGGAYYLGSYGLYRNLLARLAKLSDARVFAINYRLAPQHPFPAAVEDALAAYLYMLDPPEGIDPVDPNSIVVAGDSAGGGLSLSLLLALRDAGLPLPGGAMTLSPWVDLTHSLPSIINNISTDYLPPTGFKHAPSKAQDYTLLPPLKRTCSIGPFAESDLDRVQFYADNRVLKHPLVSPVFDKKSLRGLPKLLIQTGTAERLHDEAVYAALLASDPLFSCNDKKDDKGDDDRTDVTLEIYVDQPHVFQIILPTRSSTCAIKRLADFVRDATVQEDIETSPDSNTTKGSKLKVHTISPRGNISETKNELLDTFKDGTKWTDWQASLAKESLRSRLEDVEAAVAKLDV
ncbi:Alpha/Beta hydrolase protein [Zychaea mexicana]|uniref:Alpha/Beta hydrolase protein n=1 Tax=Zychaea mexicana TaxID=64656 RepID=UPI0022FF1D6D|nr:Alpha/Beta hydrolase protein [Zychaea mexicana]KAI9494724.1 Alpha/Beta hydrolase protein [Zychaea mexicana]